ncbi:MAG: hypothetical protein B7Z29_05290 [Hyphomicrobium sp. 12-62-95]|nr:MAG: hypothetical protein B7Z29_05290 [Hyphomicrobium sp. 12-62-95]
MSSVRPARLSRREWAEVIADTIYEFDGTIYYADGRKFEPSDTEVDDTFDDPDFRWISDFLKFAGLEPRQRLIALNFRNKHP